MTDTTPWVSQPALSSPNTQVATGPLSILKNLEKSPASSSAHTTLPQDFAVPCPSLLFCVLFLALDPAMVQQVKITASTQGPTLLLGLQCVRRSAQPPLLYGSPQLQTYPHIVLSWEGGEEGTHSTMMIPPPLE